MAADPNNKLFTINNYYFVVVELTLCHSVKQ